MSAPSGPLLTGFRITCFVAAGFGLLDAGLALASLALADHLQASAQTIIVSVMVATVFVSASLLLLRICSHISYFCRRQSPETWMPGLAIRLQGLLTCLFVAGLAYAAIVGMMALAFLSRIGEGFAIFG